MKAVALVLCLLTCAAQAQTQSRSAHVYRCGPEGKELRDSPCPAGPSASSTLNYDQPSAAETRAAQQRHLADAKRAAELEKSNREAEAKARQEHAHGIGLQTITPPPGASSSAEPAHTHKVKQPRAAKPPKPQPAPVAVSKPAR